MLTPLYTFILLFFLGLSTAQSTDSSTGLLLKLLLPDPIPDNATFFGPRSPVSVGSKAVIGFLAAKEHRRENATFSFIWRSDASPGYGPGTGRVTMCTP